MDDPEDQSGYLVVNSEKNIFKKIQGSDYIIHGLFVDFMMHISSCDAVKVLLVTVLEEYKEYIKRTLCPKKVTISPDVVLHPNMLWQSRTLADKHKQKYYWSFMAKLLFGQDGYPLYSIAAGASAA